MHGLFAQLLALLETDWPDSLSAWERLTDDELVESDKLQEDGRPTEIFPNPGEDDLSVMGTTALCIDISRYSTRVSAREGAESGEYLASLVLCAADVVSSPS